MRPFRRGEKALQKYPNSFRVVYECAQLCQVAGIELGDGQMLRRCRELFRRSLGLLDQNRDPEIGEISIRNDIAAAYLSQGEREKGDRPAEGEQHSGHQQHGDWKRAGHGRGHQ